MLVLAGPGSGKTFTITTRLLYLIQKKDIPPENILVITFTKDAALSMQQRFQKACGDITYPVNFGTFHSVFYQILKQSGYQKADHILTGSEKKNFIFPILTQLYKEKASTDLLTSETALQFLSAISYYKNTGEPKQAQILLDANQRPFFEAVLAAYEQRRKKALLLDFDDMLFECYHLLTEDGQILSKWQKQFSYILIDEFQDINQRQYDIVKLLALPENNLFVVGDDDQSIYGFRGSKPELMKDFLHNYPDCKQVLLDINYRSVPQIVEASQKVIAQNKNRFSKELRAVNTRIEDLGNEKKESGKSDCGKPEESSRVTLCYFQEQEEQYQAIAKQLKKEAETGNLEQCAVLFRTNSLLQSFALVLKRLGIPYVMKEKGTCVYDHFIAKDVRDYLLLSKGDRSRSRFLCVMNKPSRYISREALEDEDVDLEKVRAFYRSFAPMERQKLVLPRLLKLEEQLKHLSLLSPYLGLQYIRKGIGYEEYLYKKAAANPEKLQEWMEFLEFLGSEAKHFTTCEKWFTYQELFRRELTKGSQKEKKLPGVCLMTAHASKGLEFERVWIPDVNEGIYPHGRMPDKKTVEEECRMLYVAMTRAKEALTLTCITGTKERPKLPSRFLDVFYPSDFSL